MNTESEILFDIAGSVATITLNRPSQHNAINAVMRRAFIAAFDRVAADDAIHVAVIRGAGERAFSSGADLKEIGDRTPMQRRAVATEEPAAIVRACTKPVIAAIQGYAFGGGLEIALACDMRVASENAIFCFPEITRGWFPAAGGTQALPRLVGMGMAMELILSGRRFDAAEASRIGLLNSVHKESEFESSVTALAERIGSHKLGALTLAKAALQMSARAPADIGFLYEKELGALSYTLEGRSEALAAFAAGQSRA
jgi:enoyl-CoA hydratase/carnithine racemase